MMELKNINKDKKYLLAVSGGIDSMVMADLFLKQGVTFSIAHCNFSLRDEESELDEQIVREWCKEHQVTFFTKKFDTLFFAENHSLSIQESARKLRYDFFDELLEMHRLDLIVTAHHQDDNIETVLFHFLRGTGIKGLTGIPEVNHRIIRPMLPWRKNDIIVYATRFSVPFRTDSSNLKNEYTRNKIRNSILPFLEEAFPGITENIGNNIQRFKDVYTIYQDAIHQISEKLIEKRGKDFYIPIRKLMKMNPVQTVTYELIKPFDFNFEQAGELLKLSESQTGSLIQGHSHRIVKNRDFFIITSLNTVQSEMVLIEKGTQHVSLPEFDLNLTMKEKWDMHKNNHIEMIDADQLTYPLILRKWRQRDYLYPLGMTKKKKVSRVLIDAKLSLPEKEKVWVLESDKKIVWILGIRLDNRFKLSERTKNLLQIECIIK